MIKVTIKLTPKQNKDLKPLFDEIERIYYKGKPGGIIGQVYEGYLVCGVLDHETSKKVQIATGVIQLIPDVAAPDEGERVSFQAGEVGYDGAPVVPQVDADGALYF